MKTPCHAPRRTGICALALALALAGDAFAQVWIGTGFDGLSQQYYLSEIDTSLITPDSLLQLRQTATELNEGKLSLRTRAGEAVSWDQTTALTSISWHHQSLFVAKSDRSRPTRGLVQYRLDWKSPHDSDEPAAFSNFVVHEARAEGERALGASALKLSGSGQWVHYPEPGELAYDYRHYRAVAKFNHLGDELDYQEGQFAYVRREVPDSTRLSYREASASLGMGTGMGDLFVDARLEGADRRYDNDEAHIDFSVGRLRLDWRDVDFAPKWSGTLEVEGYNYYHPASPISDFVRAAVRPRRSFPLGAGWSPFVEPGVEAIFADASLTDENYFEPQLGVGVDYLSLDGLWMSGVITGSRRNYRTDDQDGLSDYWRFGVNAIFDGRLWRGLSGSILVSQDWEWHSDSADDISLTLVSAGLRYRVW
jgi:hypothetical protein